MRTGDLDKGVIGVQKGIRILCALTLDFQKASAYTGSRSMP